MNNRPPVILNNHQGTWVGWMGERVRYLARGIDSGGTYSMSYGRVPVGTGPKPHSHTFEELFFVVRGELEFTAGNESVIVPSNGSVSIGAGTAHYFTNHGPSQAEIIVITAPSGFDQFQMEVGETLSTEDAPVEFHQEQFLARMKVAAPKFGIDLDPAPSAFQSAPRIQVTLPGEGRTIGVVGDIYRFLATGEGTESKYSLIDALVPSGSGPPPHIHRREEEGFFILDGEITFQIGEQTVVATAGTFANVPVGIPHSFKNESSQPARMLICLAPAGLEKMFFEVGARLDDGATAALPPSHSEIETLLQVAPRYGIEIHPKKDDRAP